MHCYQAYQYANAYKVIVLLGEFRPFCNMLSNEINGSGNLETAGELSWRRWLMANFTLTWPKTDGSWAMTRLRALRAFERIPTVLIPSVWTMLQPRITSKFRYNGNVVARDSDIAIILLQGRISFWLFKGCREALYPSYQIVKTERACDIVMMILTQWSC